MSSLQSAASILDTGLFITMVWLLLSIATYSLIPGGKNWEKSLAGFFGCSLLALIGIGVAGTLIFQSSIFEVWFETTLHYNDAFLLMLSATTLVLIVFVLWISFLIRRGGIWPPEWSKRALRLIPSVASLILLVTLTASYLRFRQ
jgi:hypothetical protein